MKTESCNKVSIQSFQKLLAIVLLIILYACSGHDTGAIGKEGRSTGERAQGKTGSRQMKASRVESNKKGTRGPFPMGPLPVDVYKVPPPHDIPVKLKYPGRAKSTGDVIIVARVSGVLEKQFFQEGEYVKKGALLFRIEPDLYKADVDRARARLNVALADLKRAERDWKRISKAYKSGAVSEKERDTALSAYESAKASVSLARAELKRAELNLKYTDVTATISGKAGMRLTDPGNMVTPGTPLVKITSIDPIYVEFSFPDMDMIKMRYRLIKGTWENPGSTLKAKLFIEGHLYNHEGYVDFIDSRIDEDTASVKARAIFPNPEGEILPGEFVRIVITGLLRKKVIEVPQQAVIQTARGANVFVVEHGKASIRPVKLGDEHGTNFIIEEGLKSGEMVIVSNLMKVRPGMAVQIRESGD